MQSEPHHAEHQLTIIFHHDMVANFMFTALNVTGMERKDLGIRKFLCKGAESTMQIYLVDNSTERNAVIKMLTNDRNVKHTVDLQMLIF